jgi:hypothetical protein
MRELQQTGYMSSRGRMLVCSYLCYDLGLDWRIGAHRRGYGGYMRECVSEYWRIGAYRRGYGGCMRECVSE